MKIKLDENMPAALAEHLRVLGHDVHTVPDEGLAGAVDPDVWAAAQRENRYGSCEFTGHHSCDSILQD
jgi:predicted nuclease of predicted toxin-antitoxin system